jgi:hypothetical protein
VEGFAVEPEQRVAAAGQDLAGTALEGLHVIAGGVRNFHLDSFLDWGFDWDDFGHLRRWAP